MSASIAAPAFPGCAAWSACLAPDLIHSWVFMLKRLVCYLQGQLIHEAPGSWPGPEGRHVLRSLGHEESPVLPPPQRMSALPTITAEFPLVWPSRVFFSLQPPQEESVY